MARVEKATVAVTVKPINLVRLAFEIVGLSPYVQHRFSEKAQAAMVATQKAGGPAQSKKVREPKDFTAKYEDATYRGAEGEFGIPAAAFRNAMISACRTVGYKMTHAKLAMWIIADGFDAVDGTPLVWIFGERKPYMAPARNSNGSVDIRCRPMWHAGWMATVKVEFDGDMFATEDVANLMKRAGLQVGVGEGRNDSRRSPGLGWGMFDVGGQAKGAGDAE